MRKETRVWVQKAEDDYLASVDLIDGPDQLHDQVCFHCQQSAEKYLKALLEEAARSIPKIHDLDGLLNLVLPIHPSLRSLKRGLLMLSNYAVATRYPGTNATKRQAAAALRWAERVREKCRSLLGLKPS
ncbi:MAG: HEPN domain-containing protein [Pirellulaceae bacterium]